MRSMKKKKTAYIATVLRAAIALDRIILMLFDEYGPDYDYDKFDNYYENSTPHVQDHTIELAE